MKRNFGNFSHRIAQETSSPYEFGYRYNGMPAYAGSDLTEADWQAVKGVALEMFPASNWFRDLTSGNCEALYRSYLGINVRDDTEIAAATLNGLLEALRLYVEGVCKKRCELSWWINSRAYGAEHPNSPEKGGITHNCDQETMCQTASDDYKGAAKKTYAEQYAQQLLNKGVAPNYYTAAEMRDYDNCSFARIVSTIVKQFNALRADYNRISDDVQYEKAQRNNLTQLREEKEIKDWHLDIMYVDRDERMEETNPKSDVGQNHADERQNRPLVWLGVFTAIGLGGVLVARRYQKAGK